MFPLLLMLLVVGLIITMIGFFLTTKSRSNDTEYQPDYYIARRSSRVIQSRPMLGERAARHAVTTRSRVIEPIPLAGRSVVDAISRGSSHKNNPNPVARRRTVQSMPVYTTQAHVGHEIRFARYLSASAIFDQIRWRRSGESVPLSVYVIGLVSIFILGIYALNFVLPHQVLLNLITFNLNMPVKTTNLPTDFRASQNLVRLSQLDPAQYNSTQEFQSWAYSACSTASMTEVFNSYGRHYRITDVLKVEAKIGEITPQLGLLEEIGIQRTAARFGFKTTWGHNLSLDQVIAIANSGKPVIVDFPPYKYDGGHLLVVTGGNSNTVKLADSSLWNRKALSRAQFLNWWAGFYAVVTPQ
jgi:Peptidase_C39 like family